MALFSDGVLVKSPRCTDPAKYSLFSVVTPFTPTDDHWQASGIQWEDDLCGDGTLTFIDNCPPATGFTKPEERNLKFCSAEPFEAVGSYDCSVVGRDSGEAFDIARRRLMAWEGRQVERTLWTGITSNGSVAPSFAFGNPGCEITPIDLNPAGAVNPVSAFSLLEEALADEVGCGGLIHVPSSVVAYLKAQRQIEVIGGQLYSPLGFQVVAGQGYTGSGPAGVAAAAGTAWIFATGPMLVARSNMFMVPDVAGEAINRRINSITVRAERVYAVGFSCSLLAVRASLTCACT